MKDLSMSILKIRTIRPEVIGAGSLLIAEPFLSESYFNHSVIMLVDYSVKDGALGLVMNNQTEHTLDEYIDGVSKEMEIPVYCGGPIGQDRMVFMHTLGPEVFPGAKEFADGLYLGGDFDTAIDYVNSGYPVDGSLRFFVGYSGWDSSQLNEELDDEVWAVANSPEKRSLLFNYAEDHYWHTFVRSMGEPYRAWRFFPKNIRSN